MIIIQLSGGLGNQMFQYALYRRLEALGRDVRIDDRTAYPADGSWNIDTVSVRRPMLDRFGITYNRADEESIRVLTDADLSLPSRIRRKVRGRHSLERHDEDLIFDPAFLQAEEGYFTGCFQSPQYFAGIEDELRAAFAGSRLEPYRQELAAAAGPGRVPAAVHLRFGDYLNAPELYGGLCTDAYYRAAAGLVDEAVLTEGKKPCFFVFSNDHRMAAEWIERNFPGRTGDFVLCGGGDEGDPLPDLLKMAACRHHIIANSSFSWWASFLGKTEGQVVAAPSLWLKRADGSGLGRTDIYRDEMIRVTPSGIVLGSAAERMYEPLVSYIIPAYNVESYIARSVAALTAQTWRNLEVLVIDDGSADGTGRAAEEAAAADGRVRVIHQANSGVSAARNRGLDEAKGEYIGFMDSDDDADPDMTERMMDACLAADAPLAVIPYRLRGEDAPAEKAGIQGRPRLLSQQASLTAYALEDEETSICNSVWNKLFRRDITEGLRFEKGRESEDILYTTRALLKTDRIAYIPRPMYIYTADRSSSIMNAHIGRRRIDDEIPFWKEQMQLFAERGLAEVEETAFYGFCRRMLFYDLDFRRTAGMEEFAAALEAEMASMRERIREVYGRPFVKRSDRFRMALFLRSPALYEKADRLRARFGNSH